MSEVTFREFAGALMQGNRAGAASMLEQLLGLPPEEAVKATDFFGERTKDPVFLTKAMGLRNAVQTGTDEDIANVLAECFGLDQAQRAHAVAVVRNRYPTS
jgi:hypothetical protein